MSSQQLIARKRLDKARHLDVDFLWIQRIPKLEYVGEYLDQEAQEVQEAEVRRASSRSKVSSIKRRLQGLSKQ